MRSLQRALKCRRLLLAVASVCLLTSCGTTVTNPVLTREDVVGTWVSPRQGTIVFYLDQQFLARDLDLSVFYGPNRCDSISGSGT